MTLLAFKEWVVAGLIIGGTFFVAIAALGLLRLPDLFNRMHAAAKSGTLGIALLMVATALHFATMDVAICSMLVLVFFFLTVPIASHLIGRSAYFSGVSLWSGSVADELRGKYDERTHQLAPMSDEERDNEPTD